MVVDERKHLVLVFVLVVSPGLGFPDVEEYRFDEDLVLSKASPMTSG